VIANSWIPELQTGENSSAPPGSRFDRWFFSSMILAMIGMVATGFAAFYLRGAMVTNLGNAADMLNQQGTPGQAYWFDFLQVVHGPVCSSWMILLLVQATLVSAGRTDIHRRLGVAGASLAGLVVVTGFAAAVSILGHCVGNCSPATLQDLQLFYATVDVDLLIFVVLIAFAIRMRKNIAAHKRLMLMATISILSPAPFRYAFDHGSVEGALLMTYVFVVLLVVYDLWSRHKVHRATLWSACFMICAQQFGFPFGRSSAGHAFAAWLTSLAA
jgi:hypothetical protein